MINKIVKVNDISFIQYCYPEFITLSYVTFLNREDNVIYIGKPFKGLDDYLKKNTKSYINTVGMPDIDLTTRESLIKWAYARKDKKLNASTQRFLEGLNDKDFMYAIKIFLQIGKLPYEIKRGVSIYNLFKSFSSSTVDTLKILYALLDAYPLGVLESSLLTFLDKVANDLSETSSSSYGLLISNTRQKYGRNIKPALLNYTKSEKNELDFINLVLSIRSW